MKQIQINTQVNIQVNNLIIVRNEINPIVFGYDKKACDVFFPRIAPPVFNIEHFKNLIDTVMADENVQKSKNDDNGHLHVYIDFNEYYSADLEVNWLKYNEEIYFNWWDLKITDDGESEYDIYDAGFKNEYIRPYIYK